jgi:uncharacterized spore protein YtfJ
VVAITQPTCFTSTGSITVTSPTGSNYLYSKDGTSYQTTATFGGLTANTTYSITYKLGNTGCPSLATTSTLSAQPTAPAAPTVTAQVFCSSDNATVASLPDGGGSYKWYTTQTGGSALVSTVALSTATYYVSTTTSCESSRTPVGVTINPASVGGSVSGNQIICSGNAPTTPLTLSGNTGNVLKWQKSADSTFPNTAATTDIINNTTTLSTAAIGNLTTTTYFRAVVQSGNSCAAANASYATITVNPTAPASVSISPSVADICAGTSVTFTATPTNGGTTPTYQWKLNGSLVGINSSTYTSTTLANSDVVTCVLISNAPCATGSPAISNSVSIKVTTPTAAITPGGATTFCQGGNVVLNASMGASYQWNKDGVAISGATAATYTATTAGDYTVTVTTNSCPATSATTTITVNPLPTATITPGGATTFCQGGNVVLSAPAGAGYSYQWSKGGVTIKGAPGTAPTYTATTAGDYTVTVTANGCPVTSAATTVTVNPLPTATITLGGATTFCQGSNVVLSAPTGTGYSYQWNKGGVAINGATAATYTASTSGDYTVTVTNATDCTVTSGATTTITVTPLPTAPTVTAAGEGNQTTCSDGTASQTLTATASAPSGASVVWYTSSIGTTTTTTPTQAGVGTTTYYAASKTTTGSCESASRTAVTLTINALPSAAFSYSGSPYCKSATNPTPTITGATGGTFSSTSGLSLNSSTGTIDLSASTAGTYSVTYTVSGTCGSSSSASITITDAPVATFSYVGSPYCTSSAAVAATLGTGATAGTFTSTPGLTLDATTGQITPSSSTPGTYTVTNTIAASGGCAATSATYQVVINAIPAIVSQPQSPSTPKVVGESVTFTATVTGTGLSYQWYKVTTGSPTALSGATNATFSIAAVTTSDAGGYYVVVSGTCAPAVTSATATLTVDKADASSSITLANLRQTYSGSSLAATATSTASGTNKLYLTYNGSAEAPTNAGSYAVVATLDNANYSGSATGTLVIDKADQEITWTAPTDITYGTPLSDTQLNASVTTGDGTLTYLPVAGAVLDAGTQTLSVTAAATNNYNKATKTVSLKVNKADQVIAWTAPTDITYGTPLSATQLNASVTTGNGALTYTPALGTVLDAGTQTLSVTAAATDNYNEATKTVSLTVNKADQTIAWTAPTAITYGIALSATQLNATATGVSGGSAAGALTYSPVAGTVLNAGDYNLQVDAAATNNYNAATASVSLKVNKADQTITWAALAAITYGTPLSATQLNATATGVNGGSAAGALTYTPALNAVLNAGTQTLSVTAAATNNYNEATTTVSLTVNKAEQVITWNAPAAITYGTALSNAQLNATVTKGDGALTYSPASGEVLNAGTRTLSVTAAATDNYNAATKTVSLTVNKAEQTITWAVPTAITYGTALSTDQLNAKVTKGDGALTYSPVAGTVPDAGTRTLSVTAAATDNYNEATKTVSLTVNKAEQTITWTAPAAITYGTALSVAQLNATATGVSGGSAAGALTYSPVAGTVLDAGTQPLSVTAAATNNYNEATKTVSLKVNKADQTITWNAPTDITYGTALSATQLNATVTGVTGGSATGTLTYSPASGTVLNAGVFDLKVDAAATDNYNAATKTVSLTVNKAEQVIAWNAPTAITYGTALSAAQLNATVTKGDGALTYSPVAGTVLNAGTRTLSVTAAATDNYNAATKTVSLTVNKANQTIAWTAPAAITYGTALSTDQLNATVTGVKDGSAAGALTYSPVAGTVLDAGTRTLNVTAAATDNYNVATASVSLTVNKADQTIAWTAPAAITYGTPLSATQLNATATGVSGGSATGTLTYSPASGTVLSAGVFDLKVDAAATDNYNAATKTVSLTVNKANQTIAWTAPAAITYGTALSTDQLNATVTGVSGGSATGALTYLPTAGVVLGAGTQTLSVTAAATDNYNAATKTVSLTVNKANQTITWAAPAAITYGTPLSATQLNATVTKGDGALTYTPASGAVLDAGTQTLNVTAAATANYNAATASVSLTVNKAEQTITWAAPAAITYGTPLSATQLNATATGVSGGSAAGTLTYSPASGAVLNAGIQTLSVTAAATNNYNTATTTVSLTVNKADQTITWTAPAAITYGTPLSATQLNATATGVSGGSATGTLTYSPASGTVLDAGVYNLQVDAAATDNYNAATKTVSLTVNKANQMLTWATPAAIIYGTPLSTDQLNATATGVSGGSATGALTYSPVAGTVFNVGTQTLSVAAAATDNYNAATKTVSLTVNPQSVNPVADTYYTGSSFYWTTSSSSNTTTLNLVATLKTNANYIGDIRTAKVSFFVRNGTTLTPIGGAQNLPVGLVNPGDLTTGTAATNVQYNVSGSTTILDIAVVVSGNYKSVNDPKTDMPVTVAIPKPGGQITGGGKFDSNGSAGYIKGSSNYAFYVQYNKSVTNPQGGAEVTVYSNYDRNGNLTNVQHTYQLKSNAISVLATTNPTAQFSSKANISEIVNGVAQSIEGNCTMQLDMYDGKDNPAVTTDKVDRLAITVYRNNGGIWYSSNWDGTKTTVREVDAKGVISVTGTNATVTTATSTTKAVAVASVAVADAPTTSAPASNLLEVFPAPMVSDGTIHFHTTEGGKAQVYIYNALGALVTTLYNAEVEGGQEYYLPLSAENMAEGVYSCRLIVNGKVENKRFNVRH